MEEMVALIKDTIALREPLLQLNITAEETKGAVEETKKIVERAGATVKDIFKSIEGSSPLNICKGFQFRLTMRRQRARTDFELAI